MVQVYASKNQIARAMGVDPRTIDTKINRKEVIVVYQGDKKRYILAKDLFAYLAQQ